MSYRGRFLSAGWRSKSANHWLTNSRDQMTHARDEYLMVYAYTQPHCCSKWQYIVLILHRYSIFVLEASTSNRLTYFVPPLVCLLPSSHTQPISKKKRSCPHPLRCYIRNLYAVTGKSCRGSGMSQCGKTAASKPAPWLAGRPRANHDFSSGGKCWCFAFALLI